MRSVAFAAIIVLAACSSKAPPTAEPTPAAKSEFSMLLESNATQPPYAKVASPREGEAVYGGLVGNSDPAPMLKCTRDDDCVIKNAKCCDHCNPELPTNLPHLAAVAYHKDDPQLREGSWCDTNYCTKDCGPARAICSFQGYESGYCMAQ